MPPKEPASRSDEPFRNQLGNMIDVGHALVTLDTSKNRVFLA